ncbi:uncharacterized protein FFNC_15203 [Fusarium fujikuroi]|nr:uncharacterized protein FFNC_15203 [Fusarium fujikuroi]
MTAFTIVILLGLVRDKDEVQWRGPKSTTMTYSPEVCLDENNHLRVQKEIRTVTGGLLRYLALGGNV